MNLGFPLRALLWLALGAAGFAAPIRTVPAQFTVLRLEEHIVLGRDSLTQVIQVRSESDTLQQLRIEVKDWIRDSLGNNLYDSLGTQPSSCGGRLEVFPLALQLPPRSTQYLRVSYAPRGAEDPGCWSIILLEAVKPPSLVQRVEGAAVTLTVLTGVKLYIHRAGEVSNGAIDYADVEERWEIGAAGDSALVRELVVRFSNTGTSHLQVRTKLELRTERASLLREIEGPEAYITPGAFRDVIVRLPELATGRYAAIVLLDYGASEILAAQVEFSIP